jgi:hypothetical protein
MPILKKIYIFALAFQATVSQAYFATHKTLPKVQNF